LRGLKVVDVDGGDNPVKIGSMAMELAVEIEGDELLFCWVEPKPWWKSLVLLHFNGPVFDFFASNF